MSNTPHNRPPPNVSGSSQYTSAQPSNSRQTSLIAPPPQFVPKPMPTRDKHTSKGMTPLFQHLTKVDSVIEPNFDFC